MNLNNFKGLTTAEANEKLKVSFNELPTEKKSVFIIVWDIIKEPMFILLIKAPLNSIPAN